MKNLNVRGIFYLHMESFHTSGYWEELVEWFMDLLKSITFINAISFNIFISKQKKIY